MSKETGRRGSPQNLADDRSFRFVDLNLSGFARRRVVLAPAAVAAPVANDAGLTAPGFVGQIPQEQGRKQTFDADLEIVSDDVVLGSDQRDAGRPGSL